MDSDSDDNSLFITQNTFRENLIDDSTELSENVDNFMDLLDKNELNITAQEQNDFSDIDEEQLIKISQQFEEKLPEFGPYSDISDAEDLTPNTRFHFKSDEEAGAQGQKRFAGSTEEKIKWAVNLFKEWKSARNKAAISLKLSPIYVELQNMTKDEINYTLSRFIIEIAKKDGSKYPGSTLKQLVICIQFYLQKCGLNWKLLSDPDFLQLKNTLDNTMKDTAKQGIGMTVKKAQEITLDEEELLWQKVLGSESPRQLLHTIFYLIGLRFSLRGGQEQRDLCTGSMSQLSLGVDNNGVEYLQYTQNVAAKNLQGGVDEVHIKGKQVCAYASINKDRCIVNLYKKYMGLCPNPRPSPFYLRPLSSPKFRNNHEVWYSSQPVGRNTLSVIVSEICGKAGLNGYRTNHSLRASAASRLYHKGVEEQLIQEQTGHRSNAVREYKRTTNEMKRKISSIISGEDGSDTDKNNNAKNIKLLPSTSNENSKLSLTFNINI